MQVVVQVLALRADALGEAAAAEAAAMAEGNRVKELYVEAVCADPTSRQLHARVAALTAARERRSAKCRCKTQSQCIANLLRRP